MQEGMREVLGIVGWSDARPLEGSLRTVEVFEYEEDEEIPESKPIGFRGSSTATAADSALTDTFDPTLAGEIS